MKLLITGALQYAEKYIDKIKNLGYEIVFMQNETDDLPCLPEDVEAVICNGLFLHHAIEDFTNLTYIQLTSVGFDRVPMEYVKEHNIEIHNARGVYSIPMAEFAISGVLQLYKKSDFFALNKSKHEWIKNRELLELNNKNVAIIGCGSVGTECAKRFKAFCTNVISVDIVKPKSEFYDVFYSIDNIKDALLDSDIVVLTLPLTENTKYLFDKAMLKKMKKGSVLVNIARGAIVDESALIEVLDDEILSGAVLDVFESEPLESNNRLWDMKNVVVTPHNSFVGENNSERLIEVIINNLIATLNEKKVK